MKTSNSSTRNEQIFVMKQILFAMHIIIICLALPILSYLQLTYKSNSAENGSHSAVRLTISKHNSTVAASKKIGQPFGINS
ncbi:MAG: hypothetical protein ABI416_13610 [Ginsengibacter sp.]